MDMLVRGTAASLTRDLPQKHFPAEAERVLIYARDKIRYLKDINGVETLHDAATVIRQGQGDCDDKSILIAALLLSIGHTPRFVALSLVPGQFCHVWVQDWLHLPGEASPRWVDLEATEPIPFGQRVSSKGAVKHIYMAA